MLRQHTATSSIFKKHTQTTTHGAELLNTLRLRQPQFIVSGSSIEQSCQCVPVHLLISKIILSL